LPADLVVTEHLAANNCRHLERVAPLDVAHLSLQGCTNLRELADGLVVCDLNLSECHQLAAIPPSLGPSLRWLSANLCTSLAQLPDGLIYLDALDVRGCRRLVRLPENIRVRRWIDVADSGLTELPWALRSTRVRWNGVEVPDRVAFDPASISAEEVHSERNMEMRRILLERMGYVRFVDESRAIVINEDRDLGGPRRLLRVPMDGGEDLMFVEVRCPSTTHRYLLRVPPDSLTCQQAVAWTAGFTDPGRYLPVAET
jgi:hypothetical protein